VNGTFYLFLFGREGKYFEIICLFIYLYIDVDGCLPYCMSVSMKARKINQLPGDKSYRTVANHHVSAEK
jgi:hypothetical protein